MAPIIETKSNALTAYKANPSEQNLQQYARQCANDYWLQLCSQIQIAADTCNIKAMYGGNKQALTNTKENCPF